MRQVLTVRVAFADTDAMGVAWHGTYLRWLEMARVELLRLEGLPYKTLVDAGVHLPVIEATVRYRKPARFDDLLAVWCGVEVLGRARLAIDYRLALDGVPIATGRTVHAFTDASGRVIRPPADVMAVLQRLHHGKENVVGPAE